MRLRPTAPRDGVEHLVQRRAQRRRRIEVAVEHPGLTVAEKVEALIDGQRLHEPFFDRVRGDAGDAFLLHRVLARVEVLQLVPAQRVGAQHARPAVIRRSRERRHQVRDVVLRERAARARQLESLLRDAVDAQKHLHGRVGIRLGGRDRAEELLVGSVAAGQRGHRHGRGQRQRHRRELRRVRRAPCPAHGNTTAPSNISAFAAVPSAAKRRA